MAICFKKCLRAYYDPHSKVLGDHYELGDKLGKGAFGEVRKAKLKWKSEVAESGRRAAERSCVR